MGWWCRTVKKKKKKGEKEEEKTTSQDCVMKAAPACFEQRVCHGWCLLCGSGSNCDTQLLEFCAF